MLVLDLNSSSSFHPSSDSAKKRDVKKQEKDEAKSEPGAKKTKRKYTRTKPKIDPNDPFKYVHFLEQMFHN